MKIKTTIVSGLLLAISIGTANAGNFVSQGGLTWMPPLPTLRTWEQAKYFCDNTTINGKNGWRLPTRDELKSLNNTGAMLDQGWEEGWIWSSTSAGTDKHYKVSFFSNFWFSRGEVMRDLSKFSAYVTCVR